MRNDRYKIRGSKVSCNNINKNMVKKFLTIVCGGVGTFILLFSAIAFSFILPGYQLNHIIDPETGVPIVVNERQDNLFLSHLLPPQKTTFLIIGLDADDNRADVVIVGVFNRITNHIDLISVPRDTLVHLNAENTAYLNSNGRRVPPQTKIADLFAHGGVNHGASVTRKHLEDILGISIDYEVIVGLDAFISIVDTVGPITMEIPAGGLYYNDPVQDLVISIPGGIQELDGNMAEGVVRFRSSYARGDLQRIEMQQQFMSELFKQTLQRETIMNNLAELLETFIEYVDTDFAIEDLIMYLPFIFDLNEDSLSMHTLPGEPVTLYDSFHNHNISYVRHNVEESKMLIDRIYFSVNEENDTEIEVNTKVLNEGGTVGSGA